MYHHILIPTDGSELSERAIKHGVSLAKAVGAHVTGVTVSTPFPTLALNPATITDTVESYTKRLAESGDKYLGAIKDAAAAAGVKCDTIRVADALPYRAIIDTAKKQGCDVIVIASHGRHGVSAIVLGSETLKVLTHSKIPVVVCR